MLLMPSFLATFLRQYFLLKLPVLQAQLLDHRTVVDPDQYMSVSKRLSRVKFLSTELGAWLFYLPNAVVVVAIEVYLLIFADFDKIALGQPTTLTLYNGAVSLIEVIVAAVVLLSYLPRAPRENFLIAEQFYVVTFMIVLDLVVNVIWTVVPSISDVNDIISILTVFGAAIVDLCFPLWLLLSQPKYKNEWTPRKSSSRFRGETRTFASMSRDYGQHSTSNDDSIQSITSPKGVHRENSSPLNTVNGSTKTMPNSTKTDPTTASAKAKQLKISQIMANSALNDAFCKYLAREFSLESLLFLEAVRNYRDRLRKSSVQPPSIDYVRDLSNRINQEFVLPNAVNEVNLPRKVVDKLMEDLRAVAAGSTSVRAVHIYDEAYEHIEQMLAVNHLRRFQASDLFKAVSYSASLA
nr:hypothetical protein HK105_008161 [Polyrhizophydium stewartii]